MIHDRYRSAGSGKDAETIGIEALSFLAADLDLPQRFLDLSGLLAEHCGPKPGSLLSSSVFDFVRAHEPTVMDIAAVAGIDPNRVTILEIGDCPFRTLRSTP